MNPLTMEQGSQDSRFAIHSPTVDQEGWEFADRGMIGANYRSYCEGLQNRPSERPVKRNQSLLQGLDEAIQRIRLANGPRRTLAEAKIAAYKERLRTACKDSNRKERETSTSKTKNRADCQWRCNQLQPSTDCLNESVIPDTRSQNLSNYEVWSIKTTEQSDRTRASGKQPHNSSDSNTAVEQIVGRPRVPIGQCKSWQGNEPSTVDTPLDFTSPKLLLVKDVGGEGHDGGQDGQFLLEHFFHPAHEFDAELKSCDPQIVHNGALSSTDSLENLHESDRLSYRTDVVELEAARSSSIVCGIIENGAQGATVDSLPLVLTTRCEENTKCAEIDFPPGSPGSTICEHHGAYSVLNSEKSIRSEGAGYDSSAQKSFRCVSEQSSGGKEPVEECVATRTGEKHMPIGKYIKVPGMDESDSSCEPPAPMCPSPLSGRVSNMRRAFFSLKASTLLRTLTSLRTPTKSTVDNESISGFSVEKTVPVRSRLARFNLYSRAKDKLIKASAIRNGSRSSSKASMKVPDRKSSTSAENVSTVVDKSCINGILALGVQEASSQFSESSSASVKGFHKDIPCSQTDLKDSGSEFDF